MERLTDKRLAIPPGQWQEVTHEEARELKEIPVPSMRELYYRLSLYEDTGMDPEEIKEFAEDVIRQFAYHGQVNGRCAYTAGGLSTLEWAFQICGWDDPHPCPERECEVKNCHEWATGGRPTPDGYKFLCSRHYMAYEAREEAEAALATDC